MSSVDQVEYRATHIPAGLPSCDAIVKLCAEAGYNQNGIDFPVEGTPGFWIKYGASVTLGEARTQDHVAQIVNADATSVVRVPKVYLVFSREPCRYIIMDKVVGNTVASRQPSKRRHAEGDLEAVAAAIGRLTSIRAPPNTPPGHIGGGFIGHDFFLECQATCEYSTVGDLEAQINNLLAPRRLSVDFSSEITAGLVLCPSDIDPSNFIVGTNGQLFAIDFGRTGYMPSSFVSYSLATSPKYFTRLVARLVCYPESSNLRAMQEAAGMLVISGNNSLGFHRQEGNSCSLRPYRAQR